MGTEDSWAENSAELGAHGSEGGRIVTDLVHELGARITLEEEGQAAPFAITCGAYGLFVHTRFFSGSQEAGLALEAMKVSLDQILQEECPEQQERSVEAFVARFP